MFSKYTILTHVLDGYRTTCVPGGRMQNSGGETTVTAAFVKRCADSAHVPNSHTDLGGTSCGWFGNDFQMTGCPTARAFTTKSRFRMSRAASAYRAGQRKIVTAGRDAVWRAAVSAAPHVAARLVFCTIRGCARRRSRASAPSRACTPSTRGTTSSARGCSLPACGR